MNFKKILACSVISAVLWGAAGCGDELNTNDPQSVRKYLTKQQIVFTPQQFIGYALAGDTAKMTLFLQASYEIDAPDGNGNNALAMAVNQGKTETVRYLLDHGAKVTGITNSNGETLVESAVSMRHGDITLMLLEKMKEADPELMGAAPAVAFAAKTGATDVLKMLGDAGAPLGVKGADSYYPIHLAAKGGHYDAVVYLIGKGVDVNATCGQGYTVMDWADDSGYTRIIAALKKAGAKNSPAYKKQYK